jgi:hypothetical protein
VKVRRACPEPGSVQLGRHVSVGRQLADATVVPTASLPARVLPIALVVGREW